MAGTPASLILHVLFACLILHVQAQEVGLRTFQCDEQSLLPPGNMTSLSLSVTRVWAQAAAKVGTIDVNVQFEVTHPLPVLYNYTVCSGSRFLGVDCATFENLTISNPSRPCPFDSTQSTSLTFNAPLDNLLGTFSGRPMNGTFALAEWHPPAPPAPVRLCVSAGFDGFRSEVPRRAQAAVKQHCHLQGLVSRAHIAHHERTVANHPAYTLPERTAKAKLLQSMLSGFGLNATLLPLTTERNITALHVVASLPGAAPTARKLLLTAHYDTVQNSTGAIDNGSGVSIALELARVFAGMRAIHQRDVAVEFIFFDQEEDCCPPAGSRAYVQQLHIERRRRQYVGMIDLDSVGYVSHAEGSQTLPPGFALFFPQSSRQVTVGGSVGDFVTIIADRPSLPLAEWLESAARLCGSPAPESALVPTLTPVIPWAMRGSLDAFFGDLARSDHANFWRASVPAVQLTDTGNFRSPCYHLPCDDQQAVTTNDIDFMRRVAATVLIASVGIVESDGLSPPGQRPREH